MNGSMVIQGREIGSTEVAQIRALLAGHGDWGRTRLSRELCALWGWRNAAGQIKDMSCRLLLRKLEVRGLIRLPSRPRNWGEARRPRARAWVVSAESPICCELKSLWPVDIRPVESKGAESELLHGIIAGYHYLGLGRVPGENLGYLARDCAGRLLGGLWFGAAAWRCRDRDGFLGWDDATRGRKLHLLANNVRFLILPWVQVPHLASHLLGRIARRISADWQRKYGHGLCALETFVDRERFAGTCYRAANWVRVGRTTGRTRGDVINRGPIASIKDVYVYPLAKRFRQTLCAPAAETQPQAVS